MPQRQNIKFQSGSNRVFCQRRGSVCSRGRVLSLLLRAARLVNEKRRELGPKEKASTYRLAGERIDESPDTDWALFLSHLCDSVPSCVSSVIAELKPSHGMDVTVHQFDHVYYRT